MESPGDRREDPAAHEPEDEGHDGMSQSPEGSGGEQASEGEHEARDEPTDPEGSEPDLD